MNILDWLRSKGFPWPGGAVARTTGAAWELERERVAAGPKSATGRAWFLPFVDSMSGETPGVRAAYRVMLKDPSVKASILDKLLSVAALDVAVNPGDEGDGPEQRRREKAVADFGRHLIQAFPSGLRTVVESVIFPGLLEGYSLSEKVWRMEDQGRWRGKMLLDLKSKDSETYDLEWDEFRTVKGIVTRRFGDPGERFDIGQFVYWRHLSIFENPTGMSDLRAAYRAYWLIDTAWKLRAIHLEKYTSPMLKGTYADVSQKSSLEDALERAKASTWLTIPAGAMVEAFELSQRGTADFKAAIDDLKHEIFLGISGAILQALEGSTTEGRGSSAVHKSTSDVRKWHIAACVQDVVNRQIFPDAIALNFAGVSTPILTLGGVNDAEMAQSLVIDQGLSALGLRLSRKDLYKRYGRPEPEADDALKPASPVTPPGQPGLPFAEPAVSAESFRERSQVYRRGHRTGWGDIIRHSD